jgi:hypothetical protein
MRKRHAGGRKYAEISVKPSLAGTAMERKEVKEKADGTSKTSICGGPSEY